MITEKSKLLSIVIPTYNRQENLIELLKQLSNSVVTRKLENDVEIIVIDDFSTSKINIPLMLVPIIYKTNKINLGPPLSRKIGFDISIGKFVHFHDSDDMITLNWLDSICTVLAERPETDLLLSARVDVDSNINTNKLQTYFHETIKAPTKISKRLIYRNCMGPLGGVTFSRQVLEKIEFKNMASCQDWQMYIDAIKHSKVLVSRPDIKFIFNKTGDDRISHNPRKKILGHLQLSRITSKESIFKRNIRLFYLYTCKQHIYNKGGSILKFYKKNRIKIFATFIVISLYWRLT